MRNAAFLLIIGLGTTLAPAQDIRIDANAPAKPFPHFWEQMFGSGRAILTLRESYRNDLDAVRAVTDFRYVRFHAIFHDEVGVYNEDEHGNPVYNFSYVDQIYDGLLKHGVRPFVEISFMPKKLAFNPDALHPFWYKQNVSPPKNMDRWDDLIRQFAKHLVERYGVEEVAQWYFEVWNEPNIDFWNGIPRDRSYFDLYDHTARALKSVNQRLRVGGPSTAAAAWVDIFLKHTSDNHVPVDFVSSHGYADDTVEDLFGTHEDIPMDDRVCRAVAKVRRQIQDSATPQLPLFWTEWNVPGMNESRDTSYVGAALANTVRECDGTVDMMSFWTFSDVFEEGGPLPQPFVGMFGLRAEGGINKPSYYGFGLLHKLGVERIENADPNVLVTKRRDGSLAVAVWNLVDPDKKGSAKKVRLVFDNVPADAPVEISRVDNEHGNALAAYRAMGSPRYPTEEQVKKMNAASALPAPSQGHVDGNHLDLNLEPNALVLVEVKTKASAAEAPRDFGFMAQPASFQSFQHMDRLGFRTDPVAKGDRVFPLKDAVETFDASYTWQGRRFTLDDYFQRSFVLGFLVLHDNQILLEKYFHDAGRSSRFLSNSMQKSMVSVLVGQAIEEGKIQSVNDPVVKYLPYLASGGYKAVTIKNLLQMSSGVKFDEAYLNPDSEIGRFANALILGTEPFRDFAASIKIKTKPGTRFEYQSVNTEVLGLLLEHVTGKPLHELMQENLWKRIGAESDAFLYRGENQPDECAFGCFNATLRDYGRFGLMALHGGELNGARVVSDQWMRESTKPDADFLQPGAANGNFGYGYQWWVPAGNQGAFMAMGIYGQMIYVNPARHVVIVQTSAWKLPDEAASWAESAALMDAVGRVVR
ncbi:MAG TPA: serine hydrolase [Bryobacteraceae bacterium]|nr:serine hydrolase [Bryobacteraceae bacterium]